MNDNSSHIVEDIKWFMFDDNSFSHDLKFVTWVGDGHSFIVEDTDGKEYRVYVSKEME